MSTAARIEAQSVQKATVWGHLEKKPPLLTQNYKIKVVGSQFTYLDLLYLLESKHICYLKLMFVFSGLQMTYYYV